MGTNRSPDDPLFYCLHSNVDRVFSLWQDCHDYDKIDYDNKALNLTNACYEGTKLGSDHLEDTMPYFYHGKPHPLFTKTITIRDALTINGDYMDYRYETPDHLQQLLDVSYGECKWDWFKKTKSQSEASILSENVEEVSEAKDDISTTENTYKANDQDEDDEEDETNGGLDYFEYYRLQQQSSDDTTTTPEKPKQPKQPKETTTTTSPKKVTTTTAPKTVMKAAQVQWDGHADLQDACKMSWKVENENIRIRMECDTDGWIGLGWAPEDGGMTNADCAILTKEGGKYIVQDYFSTSKVVPDLDNSQDIQQVEAGKSGKKTYMEFIRKIKSSEPGDKDFDLEDEMTFIWAYGSNLALGYHASRGSIQINLSNSNKRALSGKQWDGEQELDKDIKLYWKVEGSNIRMRMTARSNGWIAIGWGGEGMTDADMVILQKNGQTYMIHDYFSSGYSKPTRDSSQDIQPVQAGYSYGVAYMEFTRKLQTSDSKDRAITTGINNVIWAVGPSFDSLKIHDKKGRASINFLKSSSSSSPRINSRRSTLTNDYFQNSEHDTWDGEETFEDIGKIQWVMVDDSIRMRVEMMSSGWIGIGWGGQGMTGSDMVIFAEEDGRPLVLDYYSAGHSMPTVDSQQDLDIKDFGTNPDGSKFMDFVRVLDTKDKNDKPIGKGNINLIWAVGDSMSFGKHSNRGQIQVQLIKSKSNSGKDWDGETELEAPHGPSAALYWRFDDQQITLRLEVETTAWIGLGWSPDDHGMLNADMVILTKDDYGDYLVQDYFAYGLVTPSLDKNNNIIVSDAGSADGVTFMEFSRPLDTRDNMDKPLHMGDVRFIWAWGEDDDFELNYHAGKSHVAIKLAGPPLQEMEPFTGEWDGEEAFLDIGQLYWKLGNGNIRFRFEVEGEGWIGVGWGPEDGHAMDDADCVILTRKADGSYLIGDYFSKNQNTPPSLDEKQDIAPVVAGYIDGKTYMEFIKPFRTTDLKDKNIQPGFMKLIMASGESLDVFSYHESNRDRISVDFFGYGDHQGAAQPDNDVLLMPINTYSQGTWSNTWDGHHEFEGIADLFWEVDIGRGLIRIRFEVRTEGWIGVGWGPEDYGMKNSDMVIMTRENGRFVIKDYYSTGYTVPLLDQYQDIRTIEAGHKDGVTYMEFERRLDTRDPRQDRPIHKGPVRFVWGYGKSYDILSYHAEKGNQLVIFYGAPVKWDGHVEFEHRARLWWKVSSDKIRIRFEARSKGWVGIGWNPDDFYGMLNADMVILTQKNNRDYHVGDYFATGYTTPILDEKQDLDVIAAGKKGDYYYMEFERPLVTDDEFDKPFVKGPLRFIWALGSDMTRLKRHTKFDKIDLVFVDDPDYKTRKQNEVVFNDPLIQRAYESIVEENPSSYVPKIEQLRLLAMAECEIHGAKNHASDEWIEMMSGDPEERKNFVPVCRRL
eukprot:TRINITY_DN5668_c0_g1_i2.p1 TRINITY_DN5668_c0_g1~~TRINITY_DN5668_c0_g1_i2.p1  ORF type:complete len:1634 (+),score=536.28 TRINITY_DN5668_c0_g1_i2:640-4902(+)